MSDTIQCERCGATTPASRAKRFCSEACRSEAEKARAAKRRPPKLSRPRKPRPQLAVADRTCIDCGSTHGMDWWVGRHKRDDSGRAPTAAARCQTCYNAMIARRYQRRTGALPRKPTGTRNSSAIRAFHRQRDQANRMLLTAECIDCHSVFHPFAERRFTSERCCWCSDALNATARSESQARRLAVMRAGDDGITWRSVGERSDWTCHLCGESVEQVAGTAYVPRGATVDHLTPIALGGTHKWTNVALAHRRCNISRGAKPLAA